MTYTADQIALQAYITEQNAATQAWMDEAEGRFGGMFPDVDHWIEDGINTVEQFRHYMAVESYVNVYKSINGIKPRWALEEMADMTADQVEEMTTQIIQDHNDCELQYAEEEAHNLNDLSKELNQPVSDLIRWGVG